MKELELKISERSEELFQNKESDNETLTQAVYCIHLIIFSSRIKVRAVRTFHPGMKRCQIKKSPTPATLKTAPAISAGVIFSLLIQKEGARMSTGLITVWLRPYRPRCTD
jgi:hypothetical protein